MNRSVPIAATEESSSAVQLVSGNFDSKWMVVLREVERESKDLGEADVVSGIMQRSGERWEDEGGDYMLRCRCVLMVKPEPHF